jgi:hypothetical protein
MMTWALSVVLPRLQQRYQQGVEYYSYIYVLFQKLRSVLRDLITELMLSQKHHTRMGPVRNGSGAMSF